jgi:hypothetical protein
MAATHTPRFKLFVSYSHRDDEWFQRLKLHLTILERRGLVHVWSDTKIRVGDQWENEIENALLESRAAVLMITPAFFGSDYIWKKEMPHILRHAKSGMRIFPLLTKPCAWRLAEELAPIQARPLSGRALSLDSEASVDSDLADFVYELAGMLGELSSTVASEELDRARPPIRTSRPASRPQSVDERQIADPRVWLQVGKRWTGTYQPTNRAMRMGILTVGQSGTIRGDIEYPDEGARTEIEGSVLDSGAISRDSGFAALVPDDQIFDGAIIFRETRAISTDGPPLNLDGQYRAIINGLRLIGSWSTPSIGPKFFEFVCER